MLERVGGRVALDDSPLGGARFTLAIPRRDEQEPGRARSGRGSVRSAAWSSRRPSTKQAVYPAIRYLDARAALAWLERAFGFTPQVVYDDPDGGVAHAQIVVAGNLVMLGSSRERRVPGALAARGRRRDRRHLRRATGRGAVDALHARAQAAGATIIEPPHDTDYGSHDFSARDLEGHPWSFGTYQP